jgi:hypothetical protein
MTSPSYSPGVETSKRDDDQRDPGGPQEDGLVEDYRTILTELALLTTVSVLLFGFLLGAGNRFADTTFEETLYGVAIVLVATATLVFILPAAYHHVQFPYSDFEKFQERTHGWTLIGLPLLGIGFYLSLSLAIWSLLDGWALLVGALPLGATFVAFLVRRTLPGG